MKKIDLWKILSLIASKEDWYSKVFDISLTQKWFDELQSEYTGNVSGSLSDMFNLAIRILQATAQGSIHSPECTWEENLICAECKTRFINELSSNPEKFELSSDELKNLDDEDFMNIYEEATCDKYDPYCIHRCSCVPPDHMMTDYVEYFPTGVISSELINSLKKQVKVMSKNESIDWHPEIKHPHNNSEEESNKTYPSKSQVRDLIHPSLYCYVRGKSLKNGQVEIEGSEDTRYAWLPSEFSVDVEGKVTVSSYINNLDETKYPHFKELIEQTFSNFIPGLEKVLNKNVKGRNLQVIFKVATIHLDLSNPKYNGGSWHIEGMPYEHIAATCIHYLEVENITESFLEFRKPTIIEEVNLDYPQNDMHFTTRHFGITPGSHFEGLMNRYLGLIKCDEGTSVIFPNSLQHHVKEFELKPGFEKAKRTIIAFFVVDPDVKVVSTADVPPQQDFFSRKEAEHFRERLMIFRKYFIKKMNDEVYERKFSLCEH